jgi:hypothetical protein
LQLRFEEKAQQDFPKVHIIQIEEFTKELERKRNKF